MHIDTPVSESKRARVDTMNKHQVLLKTVRNTAGKINYTIPMNPNATIGEATHSQEGEKNPLRMIRSLAYGMLWERTESLPCPITDGSTPPQARVWKSHRDFSRQTRIFLWELTYNAYNVGSHHDGTKTEGKGHLKTRQQGRLEGTYW